MASRDKFLAAGSNDTKRGRPLAASLNLAAKGERLRRYRFKIRWSDGREDVDDEGEVLPDDTAARDYALRMIRELKEDGGYDEPGLKMVVIDDSGDEIFQFPFEFFQ
jgi:hypothetical protein